MRAALLALALLPSAVFATISITGPSPNQYWVQNTSNTIQWTYNQGDPTPVDIIITNQANQTLNGDFSIARFVPVSQESFTVTHVTLRVGTGYQVVFVNPVDGSQVYANSSNFEVRTPGTSPAPTSSSSGSSSGSSSSSGTPLSGSTTGTSTSSGASASSSKKSNAAVGIVVDIPNFLYACGIAAFGTLFF